MTTNTRPFPRMSAALLLTGVAAVFLTGAAPATTPEKAPDASQPNAAQPNPPQADPPAAEATKPPLPKQLSITIDQTRMLELPTAVTTVSVGNPTIADVNVQDGRLFFTGKSFGRTNILALAPTGETVLDMMVFVTSAGGGSITVYKGNKQLTYNCTPQCDRTLMPGDASEEFEKISGQMTTKMGSAAPARSE